MKTKRTTEPTLTPELAQAIALWPHWSPERQQRWAEAKAYASKCAPAFGRLLPLTSEQAQLADTRQFIPRDKRQAEAEFGYRRVA